MGRAYRPIAVAAAIGAAAVAGPARADDGPPLPRLVKALEPPWKGGDHAQDGPTTASSWAARPRAVNVMGGTGGGPVGYGGIGFEYAPVPWFVAGAAAGMSPSGATGAILPRLRLPITRWFAIGAGVPFSVGPYDYVFQQKEQCGLAGCATGFKTTRSWPLAYWVHVEPNVEFRVGGGMALRIFGGQSRLLNVHDDHCTSTLRDGCPSRLGEQIWYGGAALGYAW